MMEKKLEGKGSTPRVALVLSGGGARLKGLTAYLARKLGVPVEPLNAFGSIAQRASVNLQEFAGDEPAMGAAIGLALGLEERLR